MSRVIVGVSEANLLAILESLNELVHLEFLTDPKLQRILAFLSLRNLLSNELFFTFFIFYLKNTDKMYIIIVVNIVITIRSGITNFSHLL